MYCTTKKHWPGILKILEIQHISEDGHILSSEKNVYNMLHEDGEKFMLGMCFSGTPLPSYYYLGLDSRKSVIASDTASNLIEPIGHGYERQALHVNEFTLHEQPGGIWMAESPLVTFSATGTWDTMYNIFIMADATLLATASLDKSVSLKSGQSTSLRIGMTLQQS